MDHYSTFSPCYRGDDNGSPSVADDAFNAAKKHFEQSGILSDRGKALISSAPTIEELQQSVADSLAKHEAKSESSKTKKWLRKASEMICHYGTVLDVFVQHHPEYVALVWGTMKLLFIGVVNHGETLQLLAKSISQIAARLPRVKLVSTLYPTAQMQLAIETLYSCILEFLIRAHGWCNEPKIKHLYHAYTRPHALRYKDLLERVTACSDNIIELAAVGSQVVLHQMYKTQNMKLDLIITLLEHSGFTMKSLVVQTAALQSLQTNAQLDTNHRLSEIQLGQVLSSFSLLFEDPENCYRHHLFLRNRRAITSSTSTNQFWLSPKLAKWSSSPDSALAIVKGGFTSRLVMQDFCVDIIRSLTASAVPVVWALMNANKSKSSSISSTTDLMKYITFQALRLSGIVKTEKQMAVHYSQFHSATTLKQWIDIFQQVVGNLGEQIYIVLDLVTVRASLEDTQSYGFILELNKMLEDASKQGMVTKIKVVLLVYEAEWSNNLPSEVSGSTVLVKTAQRTRRQGNAIKRAANTQMFSNSRGRLGRKGHGR